ncbi:MAG: xanthan lyase [Muribaculaceae bacterium]|nr:xanthan lyase [Muribaculaceae bacterium]
MKFKRFLYIVTALVVALSGIGAADSFAATKSTKSKTTATSSRKKTSAKKKKTSSASIKKKKTSRKKATRKKTRLKSNAIAHKQYVAPVETPLNDSLTLLVNSEVISWIPENINPGGLRVNSVKVDKKTKSAKVRLNDNFTYLPVTSELIGNMRKKIESILPDSISDYYVSLNVGDKNYSYYITTVDKLPEQYRGNIPFVVAVDPYIDPKKGMKGDIVAMWHSHGRYFKTGSGVWQWQRPQLFDVVEDTHPMGYILPYAVPMLENAGAYVFLPRERDINRNEVIVDNDINDGGQIFSQPYYKEMTGSKPWTNGEGEGFIYDLPDFRDTENPFENGTYRQTSTISAGIPSVAAWYADIPEDGEYAVYVSYKTLPESTADARYTVNYSGGSREFIVNQTMGGGTWIYLGTFPLEAGYSDTEPIVTLSNISATPGKILTADAVKIGGGMGNIARSDRRSDIYLDPSTPEDLSSAENSETYVSDEMEDSENGDIDGGDEADMAELEKMTVPNELVKESPLTSAPVFKTSGLPRYLEGARYWLQWAGMPEYVYSPYHGTDDYKDDYTSRGHWVNYLAGGSRVLPNQEGLRIPVDVTMALHSDAGKRADDSFVGTLGIYYTNGGDSYVDGTPRSNSRTLTDMLMRQITGDIRQTWEPNWTRRSMWDKSYVEARVPEVPTSLIEFMSHQNFADMRYALDPSFRFTVSRSIYKAIGRFIAERKDRKFVVQPLPVKDFSIRRIKKNHYRLSWEPTPDRLEPTAVPSKYIIMERTADELGFHYLGESSSTHFDVKVEDNDIHSFKVIAANEGGVSFPSEVLALREGDDSREPVLIVNGFTRVSGPESFSKDGNAGFDSENDFGVPYINDISFIGHQVEFRRNAGEAFGKSNGDYAAQIIAGNTFDFPYIHGVAIAASGRGFVSTSVGAIVAGDIKLDDYKIIDLILGKQKVTVTGNGNTGMRFISFPRKLQNELTEFTRHGGSLIVSGAYVASDLLDYRAPEGSKDFASKVLGIELAEGPKPLTGRVSLKNAKGAGFNIREIAYSNNLNEKQYIVEKPDIISPSSEIDSEVFMTFSDTGMPAGVLTRKGKSKGAVMSIPLESITSSEERVSLMRELLDYFGR